MTTGRRSAGDQNAGRTRVRGPEVGIVSWWDEKKGEGVISSSRTPPSEIWFESSSVEATAQRALAAGERVEVEYEESGQHGFRYRAVRVREFSASRARPAAPTGLAVAAALLRIAAIPTALGAVFAYLAPRLLLRHAPRVAYLPPRLLLSSALFVVLAFTVAFGLRRHVRAAGWAALAMGVPPLITTPINLIFELSSSPVVWGSRLVTLAMNAPVVALVAFNWRQLYGFSKFQRRFDRTEAG